MQSENTNNICSEAVFKELYFKYTRSIRNFLFYKCGDADLAEDLMQEAFLKTWKMCHKIPYEKAKSYLFTVANRLFLDHVKHQRVVQKFQLQIRSPRTADSPLDLLEMKEFKEEIESALSNLPEKNRLVFLLNRIDNFTYAEIADLLNVSVKTVEKRMHFALVELRKLSIKI